MQKKLSALLLLFLLAGVLPAKAQQKELTIHDAVMGGYSYLNPEDLTNLQWIKNTNSFSYINFNGAALMKGEATKKEQNEILSLSKLNSSLLNIDADTLKSMPKVDWLSEQKFVFKHKDQYITYEIGSGKAQKATHVGKGGSHPDLHFTTLNLAYTKDNKLYITKPDGESIVIGEDDKGIVYGQAAHRFEFGIEKGTFWSPLGSKLAFYRVDESMVTDYPILDITARPAKADMIKYPMAGDKSHQASIGVCDLNTRETIYLKTEGPAEQYLTNITWSPDEKSIYVAVLNREQNHLWLRQFDATTGELIKTLFEEQHDKYVEPLDPLIFVKNNPKQFLWLSQQDGYKHFYLYDTDGKLIRQLTKGEWVVTDFLGFAADGKTIFYTSTAASPLERHPYSISLNGGSPKKLVNAAGVHKAQLNDKGTYLIDGYSSLDLPREIVVADAGGKLVQTLLKAKDPLAEYRLGETRFVELKANDGTKLYGRIITPPGYDPGKKYPVVVYVYGGPHLQLVTNSWLGGSNLWMQYMAQQGYIMFSLDNRGSHNRGRAFEQAVFRRLGTVELQDQLVGAGYLKSLPYVDTSRMGIHGWSFGGFMTTSMMLRHPEVFKVGVAGGPVIDWRFYEVMYTERYMDTPQENPEGYKEADLLNYLDNLKGRLLLIHGTVDDVVVWQHSLNFVKKAVDEGVLIDYFVYPGHPHNVHGIDRVHLMKKITQYFDDFLKD